MSTSAGVVTLLFTDLVASTELLARLGDDDAEELRRVHFEMLRTAISTGGGQEVKTRADNGHLAFAWGSHFCLGARLARLEAQLVFAGLRRRFARLDLAGEPRRRPGLALRGLESLPLTVTPR